MEDRPASYRTRRTRYSHRPARGNQSVRSRSHCRSHTAQDFDCRLDPAELVVPDDRAVGPREARQSVVDRGRDRDRLLASVADRTRRGRENRADGCGDVRKNQGPSNSPLPAGCALGNPRLATCPGETAPPQPEQQIKYIRIITCENLCQAGLRSASRLCGRPVGRIFFLGRILYRRFKSEVQQGSIDGMAE